MTRRSDLEEDVGRIHGCRAVWAESVSVQESWEGEVVWAGEVQVFVLDSHPRVTRCYAWEHETDDGKTRVVTVLHAPPVDSPSAAVRAAIASGQA